MNFKTAAVHSGHRPKEHLGAVMTPIYQTSTFAFQRFGQPGPFEYSRSGNPTRAALEECLARLEGGAAGFAFSSGMSAEATVLLSLQSGDRVLVQKDLYGGTYRLFETVLKTKQIQATYVDLRDLAALEQELQAGAQAIWIETPTNPLMNLVDLEAVAGLGRKYGALTVCDNTFLSPYFQRPLELGIDIVVHSTTKYINGHSDVVGGAAITRTKELAEKIGFHQNALGTGAAPQDCFLVLRGVKTLAIRMEEHQRNALAIARWLESHPKIADVLHPGLESHPQRALARKQMSGYGGTFSFHLKLDEGQSPAAFLEALGIITLAESLGGVESLIDHPGTMTHASVSPAARAEMGLHDNLLRISVGLEDSDDLIQDLSQALEKL